MKTSVSTITSYHMTLDDGREFETSFDADEYIDPKVEDFPGGGTEITYAVVDNDCISGNPRKHYDHDSTMVVTNQPSRHDFDIDEADPEVGAAFDAAEELILGVGKSEVYYVVRCGCWGYEHDVDEVMAGECDNPVDLLYFGEDKDHYPDGDTWAVNPIGNHGISFEGTVAMLAFLQDAIYPSRLQVVQACLTVTRPDITAIREWGLQGYNQGDWAQGYIYTTATKDEVDDPYALLAAELEEYGAYFRGDVYGVACDTYDAAGDLVDGDSVWGFYGEKAVEAMITEGI